METEEKILNVAIEDEVKKSYMEYAMSVIIGRAIPDFRDGLKPVHRRILFAMGEMGLSPNKPYKKSARIVGETLGKFHPHGEIAIYDTLVRMAQRFSLRHPLVDGHGNFGSVDGDSPAAMRYTEVRLMPLTMELLKDLDYDTVDFLPNFDNSLKEPEVLPAPFPNMLTNGSSGIAVGLATNIPPHNLGELIDGLDYIINTKLENTDINEERLFSLIKGPDFPTAGIVGTSDEIQKYLREGTGSVTIRGTLTVEHDKKGKTALVIKEIPYEVKKSALVEKIAELIKTKVLDGVSDLRDESDKEGIRVVLELKHDANLKKIEDKLYKHTSLQERYKAHMIGIINKIPRVFSLRDYLYSFLDFRKETVLRKLRFELNKAKEKLHILKGLKKALLRIDRVIEILRSSRSIEDAKNILTKEIELDLKQTDAVLQTRLSSLVAMEYEKLENDIQVEGKNIYELENIINNEPVLWKFIREDFLRIKEKYANERKTRIFKDLAYEEEEEEEIEEKRVLVLLTKNGYVKAVPEEQFRSQGRGGVGSSGFALKADDFLELSFSATTKDKIVLFTNKGRGYSLPVSMIYKDKRTASGSNISLLVAIRNDETVTEAIPLRNNESGHVVLLTKKGKIKKMAINSLAKFKTTGKNVIHLQDTDAVVAAKSVNDSDNLVIASQNGMVLKFPSSKLRAQGMGGSGVRGIRLNEGDKAIGLEVESLDKSLLLITSKGYGKRMSFKEVRTMVRAGGKGVIGYRLKNNTSSLIGVKSVKEDDHILISTKEGILIRLDVDKIAVQKRNSRGVILIKLKSPTDSVYSVDRIIEKE